MRYVMSAAASASTRPTWLCPTYPPFYGEVGEAAVNGQLITYPHVVRTQRDPPVINQAYALVSWQLVKEPKKLKSGYYCSGFLKVRGCYPTVESAQAAAATLIRQVDSRTMIRVMQVGESFPISDDPALIETRVEVKDNKAEEEQDRIRREAIRENDQERERIQRELKERKEELENPNKDYYADPDSLEYYTLQRNTHLRLRENILLEGKKLASLEAKLHDRRRVLADLDRRHPTYADRWVERVNVDRRKAGIPDYVPSEKEEEYYRATDPSASTRGVVGGVEGEGSTPAAEGEPAPVAASNSAPTLPPV